MNVKGKPRKPEAGSRKQEAERRTQKAGSSKQGAGSRKQEAARKIRLYGILIVWSKSVASISYGEENLVAVDPFGMSLANRVLAAEYLACASIYEWK